MAFGPFPKPARVIVADGAIVQLGSFKLAVATELKHIIVTLVKKGAHAGTERFRLKIYPTSSYATALCDSDWVALSSIDGLTSNSWIGRLRFDFARQPLQASWSYYWALETSGYARFGDAFFIGLKTDWPDRVNASGSYLAPQMRIVGFK